jgi:hypothetical protein
MGSIALILLIIGALATGTTRHKVYTGFRSRVCGRISIGFVRREILHISIKKKNFVVLVYSSCLHHSINLVTRHDKYGGTMYCFICFKVSLY